MQISDTNTRPADQSFTMIVPSRGRVAINFKELWQYRELLYFLIWRDIKVRYKQTILGASWAVIQPFMTMVVFSIFFGRLAQIPSDGIPYPIFSYAALVPWTFFANGLTEGASSLVGSANLLTKIYFPRLIIPFASVTAGVIDFAIAFIVLIGMMLFYGFVPTINLIFLPFFLLLAYITALGVGVWTSAMNVQFRDVRYAIPFLVQFWMFATPIAYPSSLIQSSLLRTIYGLNPMTGVVEGFRWALLGVNSTSGSTILVSFLVACILFITGTLYFRRIERSFADIV